MTGGIEVASKPSDPGWPRLAAAVVVSLLTALIVSALGAGSINLRARLYGPHYSSMRYDNVGGGFREMYEVLAAAGAAGFIGLRIGWLVASAISCLVWKRRLFLGRLGWVDLLLIPFLCLWGYLIYVSWGPTWNH
jgi:hypothetical protein